ncbi:MAG: LPXTG cell wall anchor domain-containing protein, partial [Ignisphaera sp.]
SIQDIRRTIEVPKGFAEAPAAGINWTPILIAATVAAAAAGGGFFILRRRRSLRLHQPHHH